VESYLVMFIVAIALLAAEMLTGTFYLLVIAIGVACGGVAGWLGAGLEIQLVVAAVLGSAGTLILRRWRAQSARRKPEPPLDVGEKVQVESWNENGSARVKHRGTQWDAELEDAKTVRSATLYIKAMRGSTLILTDRKP
jgi:membrane protein implicated in regulation of membrane protease activity